MTKVVICGAGVGGLTAGLALRRAGFEVEVYEQTPEIRTAGVGLNLWPNGIAVIYDLGLREEFTAISQNMRCYRTLRSDGVHVGDIPVDDWPETQGAPLVGLWRRKLNLMLAEALGYELIRFDHEVVDVSQDDSRVVCTFANGHTASADIVVGADGVGSAVRRAVFGPVEFSSDDLVRWRGVFSLADVGLESDVEYETFGDVAHFGWLPIDGDTAYWFASGAGLEEQEAAEEHFRSWTDTPIPRILEATRRDSIIGKRLAEFTEHFDTWSKGRVVLLGDAAHPMLPGIAQGANQALIDAQVLARCLREADDHVEAFARYEAERIPVATTAVELSRASFDFRTTHNKYVEGEHSNNPLIDRYLHVARMTAA